MLSEAGEGRKADGAVRTVGVVSDTHIPGRTVELPRDLLRALERVDLILPCHSHRAHRRMHDGVLYLNPGSPTDPRGSGRPSFGLLHLDGAIRGEIVCL